MWKCHVGIISPAKLKVSSAVNTVDWWKIAGFVSRATSGAKASFSLGQLQPVSSTSDGGKGVTKTAECIQDLLCHPPDLGHLAQCRSAAFALRLVTTARVTPASMGPNP